MSGGGGQGQDDKNSMAILWAIGLVFGIGAAIWLAFKPQLQYAFVMIRKVELYVIWYGAINWIPYEPFQVEVARAIQLANDLARDPSVLSGPHAEHLSLVVGKYLRFPIVIVLAVCCYLMYGRNIKMRYKKIYDMERLAAQEKTEWPQISPVLGQNLVKQDINKGPWAMAMQPMDFAKKYKLLDVSVVPQDINQLSTGPSFKATLDEGKADTVFAAQLGRMWQGHERLPPHKRALLAAIVARGCRDSKAAKNLIEQMNRSVNPKKPNEVDFTGADALLKKHIGSRDIQEIIQRHAYENTIFTALFLFAREDGVFATADFLWVKPVDRRFWYVLNNVGRQTPCAEAAGVHAHFLAEKALRRPLSVPMVKEATKGLKLALDEIIYKPSREEQDELLKQASEGR